MSNSPQISIIIPMYNVERYISRCLESCINQTLNNIEILIINDCGSDNSLQIAQRYAQKDSRIRIVSNATNQGTFNARLQGIKEASGIYLLFLDADDFLAKEACEVAFEKAISSVDSINSSLGESNSSLTQSLLELEKPSIDRRQNSSQSAFSTQPANLTQDTRIANANYATNTALKSAKNSTSKTASRRLDERSEVPNTRIFSNANCGESQGDSAKDSNDSIESNAESLESSLRGDLSPKQSTKHNEDSPASSLRGQSPKQSIKNDDFINNADSSDSAESSDFNLVDCHEFNKLNSRNDGNGVDSHESQSDSRNDTVGATLRKNATSCNDDNSADSHEALTSRNDSSTQSSTFPLNIHTIYQNDFEIPASMLDSLPDIVHFRSHYLADRDSSLLENLKHKVRYILPTHLSRKALKGEAIAYHFFLKSYHFPRFTIWDKCYKRSLLLKAHSVLPPISQLTMAEDMLKFFAIALFAKSYVSVDKRLYFYCLNATSSTQDRGKILARITQMHAIIKVLKHLKIAQDSKTLQSLITQRMINNLKSLIILELRFTPLQELQSQFLQEDAPIYHWLNAKLGGGQELYAQLFENLLYLAYILEAKSHLYPHICLYFKLWAYQALKGSFSIHFRRKHYA